MLILRGFVILISLFMIATVLWDGFETVVLPRRVTRRLRLTAMYTRGTWQVWSAVARKMTSISRRESRLAVYGPLALLILLVLWAALLIIAYGLLYWGLGSTVSSVGNPSSLGTDLYFSGTTLLTLGLGDALPHTAISRLITVVEVGNGFALLAVVIGYVPVLYQAFSRRETRISLLDAHAGSPPSAGALLSRDPPDRRGKRLAGTLSDWEGWSAELLESHLSYPFLAYYRSQHDNQSWVAALTMILDACALVLACGRGLVSNEELAEQAAYTFAMARHAAVDLSRVFHADTPGRYAIKDRLPDSERARLRTFFRETGLSNGNTTHKVEGTLDQIRRLYEPYVAGLSEYLLMPLPPWIPDPDALDDWQSTFDGLTSPSISGLVGLRFLEPTETTESQDTVIPPSC